MKLQNIYILLIIVLVFAACKKSENELSPLAAVNQDYDMFELASFGSDDDVNDRCYGYDKSHYVLTGKLGEDALLDDGTYAILTEMFPVAWQYPILDALGDTIRLEWAGLVGDFSWFSFPVDILSSAGSVDPQDPSPAATGILSVFAIEDFSNGAFVDSVVSGKFISTYLDVQEDTVKVPYPMEFVKPFDLSGFENKNSDGKYLNFMLKGGANNHPDAYPFVGMAIMQWDQTQRKIVQYTSGIITVDFDYWEKQSIPLSSFTDADANALEHINDIFQITLQFFGDAAVKAQLGTDYEANGRAEIYIDDFTITTNTYVNP